VDLAVYDRIARAYQTAHSPFGTGGTRRLSARTHVRPQGSPVSLASLSRTSLARSSSAVFAISSSPGFGNPNNSGTTAPGKGAQLLIEYATKYNLSSIVPVTIVPVRPVLHFRGAKVGPECSVPRLVLPRPTPRPWLNHAISPIRIFANSSPALHAHCHLALVINRNVESSQDSNSKLGQPQLCRS
jgi:hypothetical protein